MSRKLTINSLKRYYDHLWLESEEVYEKIGPYLTIHKYAKGTVLKQPGEVEVSGRFIYSGAAALFLPSEHGREYRVRIFERGNIASDLDSYFSQVPSRYGIKALTYISTFELSRENEARMLKFVPEAGPLVSKINQHVLINTLAWHEVTGLPVVEGLKRLKESHKESLKYLSNKDLAYIFKTSVSTISRLFKAL